MNSYIKIILVLCFILKISPEIKAYNNFEVLMSRIRENISYEPTMEYINNSLSLYNATDGSFYDIDYSRDDRTNWPPLKHIERLYSWAFAYTSPDNIFYEDYELFLKIVKGLEYWYNRNPECNNWWYNQIAEPQKLGEILIQLRVGKEHIPYSLEHKITDRMRKDGGHPAKWTGANRMDIAKHWIYRSCLTKNIDDLKIAIDNAFSPVAYTRKEGIQYDNSYFQHGNQLYIGGYGEVLIDGITELALLTFGTEFQLEKTKVDILSKFMRETYYSTIRGQYMMFDVLGRGVSRYNNLKKENTAVYAKRMMLLDSEHKDEFEAIVERLEGKKDACYSISPKHTHYYIGDYTLHIRPNYTFDVRMVSTRTMRCEYGNNENLKTYFMSDGCTNICVDGNEYDRIFPVWDWRKIPGTTAPLLDEIPLAKGGWHTRGTSTFAGGVSDSIYGASVYKYHDTYNGMDISANKAWFFFDKEVVCMGAGIKSFSKYPVVTTINQCLLKDDIKFSVDGKVSKVSKVDNKIFNPQWVLHNKVGYVFPRNGRISLSCKEKKGNWREINMATKNIDETTEVMTLCYEHGVDPINGTYEYIVVPGLDTERSIKKYVRKSDIVIVENSEKIQAVYHKGLDVLQYIFYERGTCRFGSSEISVSSPCALILKNLRTVNSTISIADPGQNKQCISVNVVLGNRNKTIEADFKNTGVHAGATKVFVL